MIKAKSGLKIIKLDPINTAARRYPKK